MESDKSMKYYFVHETKQNIFHNFDKRGMTLTMTITVQPRITLDTGGKRQKTQDRLGGGIVFTIGHMYI